MNDVCDCCESNDDPTKLYMAADGDLVRLCDACLCALADDGAIEP